MNSKNSILGLILLLLVAASATRLVKHGAHSPKALTNQADPTPDLVVNQPVIITYTKQGTVKSTLHASRSTHYPHKNTTVMVKPKLLIYTEQRTPWHIQAQHGRLNHKDNLVELWGKVMLTEIDSSKKQATSIKTSRLTYYPDKAFASTDQEVTLVKPNAKLQAHGMTVDLKKSVLMTKSQTEGTFDEITQ